MVQGVQKPPSQAPSSTTSSQPTTRPTAPAATAPTGDASAFESAPATSPATPRPGGTGPVVSSTPNVERAKATRDRLDQLAGQSAQARERLTDTVKDALVAGVANPRTTSALGQEGVMGRSQAVQAARTLTAMDGPAYDRVNALLASAGQVEGGAPPDASPTTERALILEAVAARSAALTDPGVQENALQEIEWFASQIRGLSRDDLVTQTSVLDLDGGVNASRSDPLDPFQTADQRTDNDGYAQRFTSSCAPAVALMARAEADPLIALLLNRDGLQNQDPGSDASKFERGVLERARFFSDESRTVILTPEQEIEYRTTGKLPPGVEHDAGAGVSRIGERARKVMDEQLDNAVQGGLLTQDQVDALRKDGRGETLGDTERAGRDAALAFVREKSNGHPTDAELTAMRGDQSQERFMRLAHALMDLTEPATHTTYLDWETMAPWDSVARLVEGGRDVPFRLSNPGQPGGHFMMFSDVRMVDGERQFLTSDPWSGRTAWINQSEITNPKSDWPRREFDVFFSQLTNVFAGEELARPD